VIIAIAIPLIPTVSRVIRANTLALREQPFRGSRQVDRHERDAHRSPPRAAEHAGPADRAATAQLGSTILTEASLSFLASAFPSLSVLGRMLSESAAEYVRTAPWLVIFPGVAISLAVFGTNLFGDALRDILDPRQRG
jgi:peptide/nickel transport system permease protein